MSVNTPVTAAWVDEAEVRAFLSERHTDGGDFWLDAIQSWPKVGTTDFACSVQELLTDLMKRCQGFHVIDEIAVYGSAAGTHGYCVQIEETVDPYQSPDGYLVRVDLRTGALLCSELDEWPHPECNGPVAAPEPGTETAIGVVLETLNEVAANVNTAYSRFLLSAAAYAARTA